MYEVKDIFMKIIIKVIKFTFLWVIFYGVVTPAALFLKIARFEVLSIKNKDNQKSYWMEYAKNKKYVLADFYSQFIK